MSIRIGKARSKYSQRLENLIARTLFDLESYDGNMRADIKRLWRNYLRPFKKRLILALSITAIWSLFPYAMALFTRYLVDQVLLVDGNYDPSMINQQLPYFWRYLAGLFTVWSIFVVCNWTRNWLILNTGQKIIYSLRRQLHEKLQALHIGYFESHETGKIVSRVLDDVKVIQNWSTMQFLNFAANVFRLIIGIGVIFALNWQLSILIVVALPFYAWAYVRLRPKVRRTSIAIRRLNSSMYAQSAERISGVAVVKAFSQEKREVGTFAFRMNNFVRLSMRNITFVQVLALIAGTITALVSGSVIYLGTSFVRSGSLSFGSVMAFITIMPNLFLHVTTVTNLLTALESVFVVLRRVFFLLDEHEKVIPGKISLDGMRGTVDFENVTFTYPGQQDPALRDVNFRIREGEKIALMGPSGAGKSTIFQLVCRF